MPGWIWQNSLYVPGFEKVNVNVAGLAFGPLGESAPLLAGVPGVIVDPPYGANAGGL